MVVDQRKCGKTNNYLIAAPVAFPEVSIPDGSWPGPYPAAGKDAVFLGS